MWWTLGLAVALAGKAPDGLAQGEQQLLAGDGRAAIGHLDRAIGVARGEELARAHALRARARTLLLPDDPSQAGPAADDVRAARAADPKARQAKLVEDTAAELVEALIAEGRRRATGEPAVARPLLEAAVGLDGERLAPRELLCHLSAPLAAPELADAHCARALALADRPEEAPDPARAKVALALAVRHLNARPPDPAAARAALDGGAALLDASAARRAAASDLYDDAARAAQDARDVEVRQEIARLRALADAAPTGGGGDDPWAAASTLVAEAAALADRYNATDDEAEAGRLLEQVLDRFRRAKPLLEAALAAAPADPAVRAALQQACAFLKDEACLSSLR